MNKNIGKFILQLFIFVVIVFMLLVGSFIAVTQIPVEKYKTSYQYVINTKYEQLVNTNGPKIILLGGSNLAFGINENIIEERTDMPVVNMGLHAGMGLRFNTEIAKANIREGDIVVLAYEYSIINKLSYFTPELVVSGIDGNLEIYKYVPVEYWTDVVKYIPTYVFKKLDAINKKKTTGVYSTESFDTYGNMILERNECILPKEITKNYDDIWINNQSNISEESKEYINEFVDYAKNKGAEVLYTFPSILDERFHASEENINFYENEIDEKLKTVRISEIEDYIFERKYMYDTVFHLNTEGANIRSERLASDILEYLNNKGVE